MEIDFLILRQRGSPLEVKSSDRLRHDSLDHFREREREIRESTEQPYILCTRDLRIEDGIVYLPLYMTSIL